jgi:hypothetical protein
MCPEVLKLSSEVSECKPLPAKQRRTTGDEEAARVAARSYDATAYRAGSRAQRRPGGVGRGSLEIEVGRRSPDWTQPRDHATRKARASFGVCVRRDAACLPWTGSICVQIRWGIPYLPPIGYAYDMCFATEKFSAQGYLHPIVATRA